MLETLVVEGDRHQVLVPGDRYAQMRNVYFIPSAEALKCWLEKCGFVDVKIADMCVTSLDEQRRTDWMTSESLAEFLDPNDRSKTIEGYPAPLRAVLTAKNPSVRISGRPAPAELRCRHRQSAAHTPWSRSAGSAAHSPFHRTPTPAAPPSSASHGFQMADCLAEQRRIGGERL